MSNKTYHRAQRMIRRTAATGMFYCITQIPLQRAQARRVPKNSLKTHLIPLNGGSADGEAASRDVRETCASRSYIFAALRDLICDVLFLLRARGFLVYI